MPIANADAVIGQQGAIGRRRLAQQNANAHAKDGRGCRQAIHSPRVMAILLGGQFGHMELQDRGMGRRGQHGGISGAGR